MRIFFGRSHVDGHYIHFTFHFCLEGFSIKIISISTVTSLKKNSEDIQRNHTSTVTDLRNQIAPLERRLQEVTRALVQAKENEQEAVRQAQQQAKIGKEVRI